jgi:hypothetical protein
MLDDNDVLLEDIDTEEAETVVSTVKVQEQTTELCFCRSCGVALSTDYGDGLCQMCFVAQGMEIVVELLSSQVQQSLFESLIFLSHQAHQREQTDAAFHSLSAAYHAAYEPAQLEAIINEARNRAGTWDAMLDECGAVRAQDYLQLAHEAQELRDDMLAVR